MSRVGAAELSTCDWLDKNGSAEYLQRKGFHTVTVNSIVHASSRLKTLHEGKRVGKRTFGTRTGWTHQVESL